MNAAFDAATPPAIDAGAVGRRAVIIDPAYLGDAVFDAALARALKTAGAEVVDLVLRPGVAELGQFMPSVNDVHVFDKRGQDRGGRGLRRMADRLEQGAYDVAYIPHPSLRSTMLARGAKIPVRIGSAPGRLARAFLSKFCPEHATDTFVSARLRLASLDWAEDPALNELSGVLQCPLPSEKPNGPERIGLALGARWATKRWPADRAIEWIQTLEPGSVCLVLIGAESERGLFTQVFEAADRRGVSVEDRIGGSVADLVSAIASVTQLVAGDTGPLHVARGLGISVVALFGPTPISRHRFGPRDVPLFEPVACRPCSPHGHHRCPRRHHQCLVTLRGARVAAAIESQPARDVVEPRPSVERGAKGWMRRILVQALGRLGRAFSSPVSPSGAPRRIALIRVDERVGNVVITTSVLQALRAHFPDAEIDVIVARTKSILLKGMASVVAFEKRDLFRRPWRFVRFLTRLRRARYDVAIDASHWHHFSFTSAFLMAWTGAAVRIAHARGPAFELASHVVGPPSRPEPELATKMRLLRPLGVEADPPPMATKLGTDGPTVAKIRDWLDGLPTPERRVVLVPGARKADHRAPVEVFVGLAQYVRAEGYLPIVAWGPSEKSFAERIVVEGAAVLAPETDLDQLSTLFRGAVLAVVNDTGPLHLAAACGTRTLSLFQASDPLRWKPPGSTHHAVDLRTANGDEAQRVLKQILASTEATASS